MTASAQTVTILFTDLVGSTELLQRAGDDKAQRIGGWGDGLMINRGSVLLLAGEPGIGKTRLTEEFREHTSSGATMIRGNCYR